MFFIKPIRGRIAGQMESSYLNHKFESHLSFLEPELLSYKPKTPPSESGSLLIYKPRLTAAEPVMTFPLETAYQMADLIETKYPL